MYVRSTKFNLLFCLSFVALLFTAACSDRGEQRVDWAQVEALAYPNELAEDGVARMEEGVYTYRPNSGSGGEVESRVAGYRTYLDLDGDGVEEAFPVILTRDAEGNQFVDLAVVEQEGGKAVVRQTVRLGEGLTLGSIVPDGDALQVRFGTEEDPGSDCCPEEVVRTFGLDDDALVQLREEQVPFEPISQDEANFDPEPLQVDGSSQIVRQGEVTSNRIVDYSIEVEEGQEIEVNLDGREAGLSIYGLTSQEVLLGISEEEQHFIGSAPATETLAVRIIPFGWGSGNYELQVKPGETETSSPPRVQASSPQVQASPRQIPTVYLTFDDGPSEFTPAVLDVLARHNARATFFTVGYKALGHPHLVSAAVAAGHTIGNHTYAHASLAGAGRQGFIQAVESNQRIIEGQAGAATTRCLRPPYGAMDAYTRAYAAEMGYTIMLWTIDTWDWTLPGVDAIVNSVLSQANGGGDVVLYHDGGGNRWQTVQALERTLPELQARGYHFAALRC